MRTIDENCGDSFHPTPLLHSEPQCTSHNSFLSRLESQILSTRMKQLLILCLSGILAVHALTVTIKNGVEQCIWEVGKVGDQLYASYEVTKGDEKNLIIKA